MFAEFEADSNDRFDDNRRFHGFVDLMKLKRINIQKRGKKSASHNKKSDALISRFAAGFCFDFHPNDSNM